MKYIRPLSSYTATPLRGIIKSIEDIEQIKITQQNGIMANTKIGDPLMPLDNLVYINRHERRKAQVEKRRDIRKGRCDW